MNQATSTAPDQLFGQDVYDNAGNKIGSVDSVWVDDATGELEFVGVKTGWLFGKTHIIPTQSAEIGNGQITFPYPESQIKDAPSFPSDHELAPTEENDVYSYYGTERSMTESPTGLASDTGTAETTNIDETDTGYSNEYTSSSAGSGYDTQPEMTLSEENLEVGKREVEAGRVRLRKVVRTEHEEVPVELQREQVSIERVDAGATDVPTNAFQEQEVEVPVMREEPVVSKEAVATGGVRLNKETQTETRTVGDEVRREDVEVERDVDSGRTSGTTY